MAKQEKLIPFIALKKLRHDGARYTPGEEVMLTAKQAIPLLELKSVVAAVTDKSKAGEIVDLSIMTKAQLVQYAKDEHELELSESLNKAELIAEITKAENAAGPEEQED